MKTSESVANISKSLILAQDNITHATKDSQNPHFRNDYASLESVIDATKQAYLDQDIVVLQGMNADGSALITRLQHASGEFYETETRLVLSKQDMQGLGSAITYGRRYALAAISNISQADDDGNAASAPSNRKPAPKRATPATSQKVNSNDDF